MPVARHAPRADGPARLVLTVATLAILGGWVTGSGLAQPPRPTAVINGVPFVHVPAGPFTMGTAAEECQRAVGASAATAAARDEATRYCQTYESPAHPLTLDGFYIMRTEVTIGQYLRLVRAGLARPPNDQRTESGAGATRPDEAAIGVPFSQARRGPDEPVTDVSWSEAAAFCAWLGQGTRYTTRLPTEAEWEKAARGPDGRVYPWGSAFDGQRLNFADRQSSAPWRDAAVDDGFADLAPVGSFPAGASPYGALDMAGNVSEWVSSRLWPYPYVLTDGREDPGEGICTEQDRRGCRVYRGGSYRHSAARVRSASRVVASHLDTRFIDVGLRCAADARP
jgi:formylglycine-generating enzyme required for sulfatase activity